MMQKSVLLGFVEAMNFIDEQDGAAMVEITLLTGFVDHPPDILDAAQNGRKFDEMGLFGTGHQARQRGFPCPGRPPKDKRKQPVGPHHLADQRAAPHGLGLAYKVFQSLWAHAVGQRFRHFFTGTVFEQIHR
jgi:hypothetical protein